MAKPEQPGVATRILRAATELTAEMRGSASRRRRGQDFERRLVLPTGVREASRLQGISPVSRFNEFGVENVCVGVGSRAALARPLISRRAQRSRSTFEKPLDRTESCRQRTMDPVSQHVAIGARRDDRLDVGEVLRAAGEQLHENDRVHRCNGDAVADRGAIQSVLHHAPAAVRIRHLAGAIFVGGSTSLPGAIAGDVVAHPPGNVPPDRQRRQCGGAVGEP